MKTRRVYSEDAIRKLKAGARPVGLMCGQCGRIFDGGFGPALVESCCRCHRCGEPGEKRHPSHNYLGNHFACDDKFYKQQREEELARHYRDPPASVERVTAEEWGDKPVFFADIGGRDGYFSSVGEMLEELEDAVEDAASRVAPRWVYATEECQVSLDADSILESALEEFHEDAIDGVDSNGLQKLLDGWCAAQTMRSYMIDKNKVVIL